MNDNMVALPDLSETPLLRYAAYAICNAMLYASAACWLVRTRSRGLLLQVTPLILLPIISFIFWVFRAMSDF
jgi:hypothetical protein